MMISSLSKGLQITIPSKFRKALGLKIGSRVEIEKIGKKLIIKPIEDELETLFAEAKNVKPKIKINAEDMDKLTENEIY